MAQTNLLELAKQGDPQAIATLMNRSLQPRGMTADVARQGNCLYVTLQAEQVPNRQVLTAFVQNGISNLGVSSIQLVKIAGQQFGTVEPAWTHDLEIAPSLFDELGLAGAAAPLDEAPATIQSLDELDDIALEPNPVSDILSELTAPPRPLPPPIPTFEPTVPSLADPGADFEGGNFEGANFESTDFAADDFASLDKDFSLEAIATGESGDLSDDFLSDLDLDLGSNADLMADLETIDAGAPEATGLFADAASPSAELSDPADLNFDAAEAIALDDLSSDLPAPDLSDDFANFDADFDANLGADFGTDFGADLETEFDLGERSPGQNSAADPALEALDLSGEVYPSSDALLSDLDALETNEEWSLDEPDELLSDLGSLEDDLALVDDDFLAADLAEAAAEDASNGPSLEPNDFDLLPNPAAEFSVDDEFSADLDGLDSLLDDSPAELEPSFDEQLNDAADDLFADSADERLGSDLTPAPEAVDFDLTDFEDLSARPGANNLPTGLESLDLSDADFDNSAFGSTEFPGLELSDTDLGSSEFGVTEFGSPELDESAFGDTGWRGSELGTTEFGDSELSDADFDLDLSSADLLGESSTSSGFDDAFAEDDAVAEIDPLGSAAPPPEDWQAAAGAEAIAAGFENEVPLEAQLTDSSADLSSDFGTGDFGTGDFGTGDFGTGDFG
ncbi:MAG: hypothetical protein D6742_18035, partial [Cyanobacteria bacterium J069]